MIRSGNYNSINIFAHIIEHLSIIYIFFSFGIPVKGSGCIFPVYICKGYNVLSSYISQVSSSHSAYANTCNI